jgi:radial spoke head protein 9
MEVEQISNHLKYINCNGVTLNIEERMHLNLSLHKLHNDYNFEELLFWGKINGNLLSTINLIGISKDYYIAMALNYLGVPNFPEK